MPFRIFFASSAISVSANPCLQHVSQFPSIDSVSEVSSKVTARWLLGRHYASQNMDATMSRKASNEQQ